MNTTAPARTPIGRLAELGTSAWLDSIRRSMLTGGELARLVREDGVVGVTSNPSIFEQAILGSPDYDARLAELTRNGDDVKDIYWTLAIEDVQGAADVLRPVYDATGGIDGYVWLEVAPDLARDTEGTLAAARELWARVDRPNVMIKIPGTPRRRSRRSASAIAEGININVTLLFSLDAWAAVTEAWLAGLEDRAARGGRVDHVASVARFFVSRVDTAADKRLQTLGHDELRGRAAVANAQLAYARCQQLFAGERFARAARRRRARRSGCCGPRPARRTRATATSSTSRSWSAPTRSTRCRPRRCDAYQDHGEVADAAAARRRAAAREAIAAVEAAGVSLDEVTDELLRRRGSRSSRTRWSGCSPASSDAAPRCSPASRPGSQLASPTSRRARSVRAPPGPEAERAARMWAKDDSAVGGRRRPDLRAARLADGRRAVDERLDGGHGVRRRRCAARASPTACCSGWAARASRRRCCDRRSARCRRLSGAARARLDAPRRGGGARGRDCVEQHALRRLLEVGRRRSSRARCTLLPRARAATARQWSPMTDPGTALEALAREQGSATSSWGTETSAGATRRCRVRHRAGGVDGRRRRGLLDARRGRRARRRPSLVRATPAALARAALGELARRGGTS